MTYKAHIWKSGDTITEDLMNALENGVANEQVGPTGVGVKSIELTADADGKITGGTLTTTDNKTSPITVTTAGA